ncbi:MAG: YCF48-related protein [Candidatus Sulfotelmatobacter sp.]
MQNVPKIVRARFERPTPATAEPHPDADLLTAFAEHSLAAPERDHVLEHLARCADCREVVVLALPATEAVALASSGSSARIGWLSLPVLRWGVVAVATLAVTSLGLLEYRQRHQEKTLVATSLMPREQLAGAGVQTLAPVPSATGTQPVAPQADVGKQTEIAKKVPSRAQSKLAVNQPAPNEIFPQPQPTHRAASAGAFRGAPAGSGFGSGSGYGINAAPAANAKQNPTPGPAQGAVAPSATTTVAVSGASPLVTTQTTAQSQIQDQLIQSEAAEPSQPSTDHVGKAKSASAQASPAMVQAPLLRTDPTLVKGSAAPRWTISASGALQHSLDGGKTWLDVNILVDDSMSANLVPRAQGGKTAEASSAAIEVQPEAQTAKPAAKSAARASVMTTAKSAPAQPAPPPRTIFRAVSVSSNAAEVWAGGSGGALYHTLDGGNGWARVVPSDAGILLTGDIIAIQFSDSHNGIVTTSNAEVWTTLDAGQTWHKQQ